MYLNLYLKTYNFKDSGDDGGALALEVANVEGVFLLLIVGSVAAILCSCLEMVLDVRSRAAENKVKLHISIFVNMLLNNPYIYTQVPFKDEIIAEVKFIAACKGTTKEVRHRKSSSLDSGRHSQSSDMSRHNSLGSLNKEKN